MTLPSDGFCHAKRGLLTLRECGKHALSSCESCESGLCEDHQIITGYGVFCPDCAAQDDRLSEIEDERLGWARYRLQSGYYQDGYYYGFTETDFGTFDTEAGEGGASVQADGVLAAGWESEGDVSDSDDLDSFMES